jgi:SAM-dependent methyltransferase
MHHRGPGTVSDEANAAQAEFWSGQAGQNWVAKQAMFDGSMAPVLDVLLDHAGLTPGQRVLDIGCGTGASLLQAGRAVGPAGRVLGADISPTMLAMARDRVTAAGLTHVDCIEADAQTHAFAPGTFDLVISRFGVMFFADPVAAFANIRLALAPEGRIAFVCWAGMADNPWFRLPIEAAVSVLGPMPPPEPRAPGPMAFAEGEYVTGILEAAGYGDVSIKTVDLHLTPPGTLADAARFAGRDGPAMRVVQHHEGSEADIETIFAHLMDTLAPFETAGGMRIPGRVHVLSAARG